MFGDVADSKGNTQTDRDLEIIGEMGYQSHLMLNKTSVEVEVVLGLSWGCDNASLTAHL